MAAETTIKLVSIEALENNIELEIREPLYNVIFEVAPYGIKAEIPVLKKSVKDFCSIVPIAQHYLSYRLENAAKASKGFRLTEDEFKALQK